MVPSPEYLALRHTRVMPDGRVIKGAQANSPFDRALAQV
jgi:hypothetical protein